MITIIIDDSMIVNDPSRVVNYALRVRPLFGASLYRMDKLELTGQKPGPSFQL
jgi:hypothetical protein